MISVPYAQLAVAGVLVLLVVGVIYAAYRWGRATERAKQSAAQLALDKEIRDEIDAGRADPIRPDLDWLRRKSRDKSTGGSMPG